MLSSFYLGVSSDNDIQRNDTQHDNKENANLSIMIECCYAEWLVSWMPHKPLTLSVIMLNAIMLDVVAPLLPLKRSTWWYDPKTSYFLLRIPFCLFTANITFQYCHFFCRVIVINYDSLHWRNGGSESEKYISLIRQLSIRERVCSTLSPLWFMNFFGCKDRPINCLHVLPIISDNIFFFK